MLHQYEPPDELDPLYEKALAEKDRVVYELRRLFKTLELKYMFHVESPPGSTILCIRESTHTWVDLKNSVAQRLQVMGYSPNPKSAWPYYRDFRPTAEPYPYWTCFVEAGSTKIYGGKQTLPSIAVGTQIVASPN